MDKNTNQNTNKMKISDKVRYGIGACCILGMLGGFSDGDILSALFLGVLGVTLLPIFYDKLLYDKFKIKQNRYLPIIIPVVAFLFMCFCMPTDTTTALDESINSSISSTNTVKEDINIYEEKSEDITLNETEESTQEIESSTTKSEEVKQETVATSSSKVETPKQNTTTSTTPNVEESKQETTTPAPTPTPTQPSQNTTNSRGVYRTPKGKRYHFDAECGGENSYSINLDSAISVGLTPCQKCAQ